TVDEVPSGALILKSASGRALEPFTSGCDSVVIAQSGGSALRTADSTPASSSSSDVPRLVEFHATWNTLVCGTRPSKPTVVSQSVLCRGADSRRAGLRSPQPPWL